MPNAAATLREWALGGTVDTRGLPWPISDRRDAARVLRKHRDYREPPDAEIVAAFQAQVGGWIAAQVPVAEAPGVGGLYAMAFEDATVKLGISENVVARRAGMQTGLPYELRTLFVIPGFGLKEEALVHGLFEPHRLKLEWFRMEGAVLEWIRGMTSQLHG